MNFKIVSFYSEPKDDCNWYTENAIQLMIQLDEYKLDYYIPYLTGYGDYFDNCRMKPVS